VSSHGEKGYLPPYDMPLMKFEIVCLEGIGRRHQNKSLSSYNKIFCPSLVCYAPGAEEEKIRGSEDFFENLSAPSPLQLKIKEGASNGNNPGHASVPSLLMPVFFLLSKRFS